MISNNLATWAKFAITTNEKDSHKYTELTENLSQVEMADMLAVLAGYLGATQKGRDLLKALF
jgi:hypothetical protein